MPAIAGVVYPDIFQANRLINSMVNVLGHRGEATKDLLIHKNFEMGICGGKIASNEKESISLVLDGNIVNEEELRKELKAAGSSGSKESGAALLIYAFEAWGKDFVKKLNGAFAIAIFLREKKELLLYRDRVGRQPLYWSVHGNHFFFSSELKGIVNTGILPQTPAEDAIAAYLFFGYVPQDMTLVKGINKLLPGYYLQYDLKERISIESYWSYSTFFQKKTEESDDEISEHLNSLLFEAVKRRVPSSSLPGSFLGGGLGSATIAYYLSQCYEGEGKISAYTVGFEKENSEDVEAARNIAEKLSLEHYTDFVGRENFLEELVPIVWHLDEPIADPNIVIAWRQCINAAGKNRVVFSGMGSDELVAGHLRYHRQDHAFSLSNWLSILSPSILRNLLFPLLKFFHSRSAFRLLKHYHTHPRRLTYLIEHAIFDELTLKKISPLLSQYFDPGVFLQKFYRLEELDPKVDAFLYFDAKTALVDRYIAQYERFSSAKHLVWHTPFLDHHLIEYLATLPLRSKYSDGSTASSLKSLTEGIFDRKFLDREKMTRRNFLDSWVSHKSFYKILSCLEKGFLVDSGYLSVKWLHQQKNRGKPTKGLFTQCWSILILELWMQIFINNPMSSLPSRSSPLRYLGGRY